MLRIFGIDVQVDLAGLAIVAAWLCFFGWCGWQRYATWRHRRRLVRRAAAQGKPAPFRDLTQDDIDEAERLANEPSKLRVLTLHELQEDWAEHSRQWRVLASWRNSDEDPRFFLVEELPALALYGGMGPFGRPAPGVFEEA